MDRLFIPTIDDGVHRMDDSEIESKRSIAPETVSVVPMGMREETLGLRRVVIGVALLLFCGSAVAGVEESKR